MWCADFWVLSNMVSEKEVQHWMRWSNRKLTSKNQKKWKNSLLFLELSKAFHTVGPIILLKKLEAYGARGKDLQLLASFLSNGKPVAQFDEKFFQVRDKNVGVPQRWSVLGPLLFPIYSNDITDMQHKKIANCFFVDDCSNLTSHRHNPFLAHEKQLHQNCKCLSANKLTFYLEKLFHLKFSRRRSTINTHQIKKNIWKPKAVLNVWELSLSLTWTSKSSFRTSVKHI